MPRNFASCSAVKPVASQREMAAETTPSSCDWEIISAAWVSRVAGWVVRVSFALSASSETVGGFTEALDFSMPPVAKISG